MNLIQKLTNLETPNIEIIYITDSKFDHQFELRTKESGIIAIGWILDEATEEEHIEFSTEFHKISAENYAYFKGDNLDLQKWDGFLFSINSNSIWSCPRQVIRLSGKKHGSIELFLSQLKGKFNELKSPEEKLEDLHLSIKKTNNEQAETIYNLQAELLAANKKIKELNDKNIWLNERGTANNKEINSLKKKNEQISDTIKLISNKRKNTIVSILTKKQINAILTLSNDYYIYIGPNKIPQPIELNDELLKPDLLVKIRDEKIISYETEYDKIPIPTWRYFTISRVGKTTPMSISTLMELPDAIFIEGVLYIDDLLACTPISVADL